MSIKDALEMLIKSLHGNRPQHMEDASDLDPIIGVGHFTLLPMLLMQHATSGAQDGTINGHGPASAGPRLDQLHQMAAQAADLSGQGLWDGFQASFPGTARRKVSLFMQQRAQRRHLRSRLRQHAQQFIDLMQVADNHNH